MPLSALKQHLGRIFINKILLPSARHLEEGRGTTILELLRRENCWEEFSLTKFCMKRTFCGPNFFLLKTLEETFLLENLFDKKNVLKNFLLEKIFCWKEKFSVGKQKGLKKIL